MTTAGRREAPPMNEEIAGLTAAIAAAEARVAAGGGVDLGSLAALLDALTARTANASHETRLAARSALVALLEGATSLVDTLDRQTGELRDQVHGLRRSRAAGRAYARLRQ